jgi:hypothetical protein
MIANSSESKDFAPSPLLAMNVIDEPLYPGLSYRRRVQK